MSEYLGNTFAEIERAIREGLTGFVLCPLRMEQVLRVMAEVTEAKNELVRENRRLRELLGGNVATNERTE